MTEINDTEPVEIKESSDTEILKPKREKKPRSEKQLKQFEDLKLKKQIIFDKAKEERKVEAAKLLLSKGIKIPKQVEETESESESEEEVIVIKKKKEKKEVAPKPKEKKKKKIVIEYSDSSDSDSSDDPPTPPPTPPQKERKLVSQQNKKSVIIKVNLPAPKIVNYFAD